MTRYFDDFHQLPSANQFVMEDHHLIGSQDKRRISPPFVVAELDFEHTGSESLDNRTNLSPMQAAGGQILKKCDHGKGLEVFHVFSLTARNTLPAGDDFHPLEQSKYYESSPSLPGSPS